MQNVNGVKVCCTLRPVSMSNVWILKLIGRPSSSLENVIGSKICAAFIAKGNWLKNKHSTKTSIIYKVKMTNESNHWGVVILFIIYLKHHFRLIDFTTFCRCLNPSDEECDKHCCFRFLNRPIKHSVNNTITQSGQFENGITPGVD